MKHPRFLLVLAIGAIAVAGCSKDKKPEQPTEQKFAVSEYEPDLRDYHSSWGHQGRGGAALRKSAYQHMVSPRDQLDTRSGRLHPELQVASTVPVAMVAVPPSTYASNCQHASLPATYAATGNAVIASAREAVDEYVHVRNKLCQGQSRLTYDEWLVLMNGTPKDLPVALQARPPVPAPAPARVAAQPIQPIPSMQAQEQRQAQHRPTPPKTIFERLSENFPW